MKRITKIFKLAPVAFILSLTSLIATLIYINAYSELNQWLCMQGEAICLPKNCYRVVTYIFIHASMFHYLKNSLLLIMAGMIIEPRLPKSYIISMIVASAVFGAVLFTLVYSQYAKLIGSGFVLDFYLGALLACYVIYKRNFKVWEHLMAWALLAIKPLQLTIAMSPITQKMDAYVVEWIVIITSFIVTLIISMKKDRQGNKSANKSRAAYRRPGVNREG